MTAKIQTRQYVIFSAPRKYKVFYIISFTSVVEVLISTTTDTNNDKDRYLTLKAPNKNCSRRHFNFLLLSFKENKAWFFL